jgi:hypothetical protein
VPALSILLTLRWPSVLKLLGLYLLVGAAAVFLTTLTGQVVRGSVNSALITNVFWAGVRLIVIAGPPALVPAVSAVRRIRGVLAMTLAATLLFGLTLMLFRWAMIEVFNVDALRTLVLDLAMPTSSAITYYGIYLILALPVGRLVWWIMQRIAVAFERKAFSDVQLIVDCCSPLSQASRSPGIWWRRRPAWRRHRRDGFRRLPHHCPGDPRVVAVRSSSEHTRLAASTPVAGVRLPTTDGGTLRLGRAAVATARPGAAYRRQRLGDADGRSGRFPQLRKRPAARSIRGNRGRGPGSRQQARHGARPGRPIPR